MKIGFIKLLLGTDSVPMSWCFYSSIMQPVVRLTLNEGDIYKIINKLLF